MAAAIDMEAPPNRGVWQAENISPVPAGSGVSGDSLGPIILLSACSCWFRGITPWWAKRWDMLSGVVMIGAGTPKFEPLCESEQENSDARADEDCKLKL
ncbi:hypothetical protein GGH95_002745 [Coemansia sp. RSA 1836]|nr:hypothetical protein GGH95_002745 [Coemansia sp. RSA 1836]